MRSRAALAHTTPSFAVILLADGVLAWVLAHAPFAAGSATDSRDAVLVREFLRTCIVIMGAMLLVAYMVFSGRLLRPSGHAPVEPGSPFLTWQFRAVAAGLVSMRVVYWWDFARGSEASVIPPGAVVTEPLRRLFVLQFGVLAGVLVVYWFFDSSVTGLVVVLITKTVADLVLAVAERLRARPHGGLKRRR